MKIFLFWVGLLFIISGVVYLSWNNQRVDTDLPEGKQEISAPAQKSQGKMLPPITAPVGKFSKPTYIPSNHWFRIETNPRDQKIMVKSGKEKWEMGEGDREINLGNSIRTPYLSFKSREKIPVQVEVHIEPK